MTSDVIISKKNEVYLKIKCEPHILYELAPYFQFEVESAKFMKGKRFKGWNGIINLLSLQTKEIYVGLLDRLIEKIKSHNYTYEFEDSKYYGLPYEENELISLDGVKSYMQNIISSKFELRNYQIEAVYQGLRHNRKLLVSPTSSGKSICIYTLTRYYVEKGLKVLIIVPTTSLCSQMSKDFQDYGWNSEEYVHQIYSGYEKVSDKPVIVSTYQSLHKLEKAYFSQYDVVVVDECFSGDMRVLTPKGYLKIKELNEGDKVINYDEKNKTFKEDNILKVHKNLKKSIGEKMYKLEFDNGKIIEVTGNHKFLTTNGWIRADELTDNHDIINNS